MDGNTLEKEVHSLSWWKDNGSFGGSTRSGGNLFNNRGENVGQERSGSLFSTTASRVGEMRGNQAFDAQNNRIGEVRNGHVFNASGQHVGRATKDSEVLAVLTGR